MRDPRTGKRFSARSTAAGEAYSLAVDRMLGSESGALELLEESLSHDPRFCMALAARYMLAKERGEPEAEDFRLRALAALEDSEEWERGHIGTLFPLLDDPENNLAATERYVSIFGYDLLVISQLCDYLIFNGGAKKLERVKRILESADSSLKTDWAYLARLGFAVSEAGEGARGLAIVERALEQRTSSLYVMHSYAHVLHDQHAPDRSAELLRQWLERYHKQAKDGSLYSHIYWHLALAEWECGEDKLAWDLYREHSAPEVSTCSKNLRLANAGGFLMRVYLRGNQSIRLSDSERALCREFDDMLSHPFIALHIGGIYLAAGDLEALTQLHQQLSPAKTPMDAISIKLLEALMAFLRKQYECCYRLLAELSEADRISVGGNYIERALIELLQERSAELQAAGQA